MKKMLSLVLAAALSLSLAACSASETPEQAVAAGLDAFKSMDSEKITLYFENGSELTFPDDMDEKAKAQYELILNRLTYTIKETKTEKDTATVTADITNLDIQQVMNNYIGQAMTMAMEEMAKPKEDQMSQEAAVAAMEKLLIDLMSAPDAATITQTVTITLHKTEKSWQIVFEPTLANALTGGMFTALEQLGSLM